MRTRRSPRNQKILWRALGGEPQKQPKVDEAQMLERFLPDPFISARAKRKAARDLERVKGSRHE